MLRVTKHSQGKKEKRRTKQRQLGSRKMVSRWVQVVWTRNRSSRRNVG